jgi:phosphoglycerate dehydrogenase-like enzyme
MDKKKIKISVASRSLSSNQVLRSELNAIYENVQYNELGLKLSGDDLREFLYDCDKAIVGLEEVDEKLLAQLPKLKVISKYGVGLDAIDLIALKKYKIALGWTPGVNKRSVSELALSMMISLLRKIPSASEEVKSGIWKQNIGQNLTGKTIGILGFGNVGKDLAALLGPFNCKILAHDILQDVKFKEDNLIKYTDLDHLLSQSDVITLHLPLDLSTKNILNSKKLDLIKPSSVLINTARGGLVDEKVLYQKLKNEEIAGAAFDVFEYEPPVNSKLLELNNFLATPHIGGSSQESILAMGRAAIHGLENNYIP